MVLDTLVNVTTSWSFSEAPLDFDVEMEEVSLATSVAVALDE